MKLLSCAVGKREKDDRPSAIAIVFLTMNEGAKDFYDSIGSRLTILYPTDIVCTSDRTLVQFDDLTAFGETLDKWAEEHRSEPYEQGIGISGDRLQIVDYEDGSLICSMKFKHIEYAAGINMNGARPEAQE